MHFLVFFYLILFADIRMFYSFLFFILFLCIDLISFRFEDEGLTKEKINNECRWNDLFPSAITRAQMTKRKTIFVIDERIPSTDESPLFPTISFDLGREKSSERRDNINWIISTRKDAFPCGCRTMNRQNIFVKSEKRQRWRNDRRGFFPLKFFRVRAIFSMRVRMRVFSPTDTNFVSNDLKGKNLIFGNPKWNLFLRLISFCNWNADEERWIIRWSSVSHWREQTHSFERRTMFAFIHSRCNKWNHTFYLIEIPACPCSVIIITKSRIIFSEQRCMFGTWELKHQVTDQALNLMRWKVSRLVRTITWRFTTGNNTSTRIRTWVDTIITQKCHPLTCRDTPHRVSRFHAHHTIVKIVAIAHYIIADQEIPNWCWEVWRVCLTRLVAIAIDINWWSTRCIMATAFVFLVHCGTTLVTHYHFLLQLNTSRFEELMQPPVLFSRHISPRISRWFWRLVEHTRTVDTENSFWFHAGYAIKE